MRKSFASFVALAGVLAASFGSIGCDGPPAALRERRAAVQSRYLAPEPMLTVKASRLTKKSLGIAEWQLFRGKGGVYLTGYDGKGKAVKGLSTEYTRTNSGQVTVVAVRVNDGTKFRALHSLVANTTLTNMATPEASRPFVQRAVLDLARVGVGLRQTNLAATSTNASNLCSQAMIAAATAPVLCANQATQSVIARRRCLEVQKILDAAGETCLGRAGTQTLGIDSVDQIGAGICASGNPDCASQIDFLDQLDVAVDQGGANPLGGQASLFGIPGLDDAAAPLPRANPLRPSDVFDSNVAPGGAFQPQLDGLGPSRCCSISKGTNGATDSDFFGENLPTGNSGNATDSDFFGENLPTGNSGNATDSDFFGENLQFPPIESNGSTGEVSSSAVDSMPTDI